MSLYVHIPFCASRCIYCAFYSTTGLDVQAEYVEAVLKELGVRVFANLQDAEVLDAFRQPQTIYFGGGTPSCLPIPLLNRLVEGICDIVDTSKVEEWTMECNPDDMTQELAQWIGSSPVNRVSMGVQTFDEDRLKWLHRRHDVNEVVQAVSLLRDNGIDNISLDLMFGFPVNVDGKIGADPLASWQKDMDGILSLKPRHISAYSLMYEEGTPLYRMLEKGRVEELNDELSLAMYDMLIDRLADAGFVQYEISNFALPGYESRHNSSYWRQVPYLGIGAAAHSYDLRRRWWNIADVNRYIAGLSNMGAGLRNNDEGLRSNGAGLRNKGEGLRDKGEGLRNIVEDMEVLDEQTMYNDLITTALRTRKGIDLSTVDAHYHDYLLRMAVPHIKNGYLLLEDNHLHLTRKGLFVSDSIMCDLVSVTD